MRALRNYSKVMYLKSDWVGFPRFEKIEPYELSGYVALDVHTRKNLELTETLREKNKYGSLLWAIDKTYTNMGARLLKSWICQPLKNIDEITKRQDNVQKLAENSSIRNRLEVLLGEISDIQRLSTRMSNGSVSPREFVNLKNSLKVLPSLVEAVKSIELGVFDLIEERLQDISDYADLIEKTIDENPPILIKDGGVIKAGVNNTLDYLRDLMTNGEAWLKNFEEREKEKTGITTLKVGYNRVFGYYIEVTNSHLNKIPAEYIRKQTLTGGERFITEELKRHEDEVLTAQVKANDLEYKLYCDFRDYSKEFVSKIREIADCIAKLDVITALATIAVENNYCKPEVDESDDFIVKNVISL